MAKLIYEVCFAEIGHKHGIIVRAANTRAAIIKAKKKMINHWIKVETVLPEAGYYVLIYPDITGDVGIGILLPHGTWVDALTNESVNVTHWRPLPDKPKQQNT